MDDPQTMGHMWHINRQVPACGIPRSYREGIVASYSWGSAKSYQFDQRNPDGSVEVYQPFISWLCLKMPDLPPILLAPFVKVPREKPWNLGLTRWFIEHFIPAVSLGSMIWCSPKKNVGISQSGLISRSFRKPQIIWNPPKIRISGG